MPKIVARFLKSIKQIKRLAKFAKMSRPKCNDEIIWSLTPEEPDGVFAGLRVDERSKNVPFRLLRKEVSEGSWRNVEWTQTPTLLLPSTKHQLFSLLT